MKTPGSFGSHNMHKPLASLIGSPLCGSTLIIEIGYTDGIIRDTKPIEPTVLSMFTVNGLNYSD